MDLIKIIREKRKYKIKFLNLTIYSYAENNSNNTVTRTFLFGLISLKQNLKKSTFFIRLFGLKIILNKIYTNFEVLYFLFFPIFISKLRKKHLTNFLDKVISNNSNYDEYYIFLSRSGEFYLLMHHFKELLQNNNSKNFLMIFCAKYHVNICKMFYPEIPYTYIKNVDIPLISRIVKNINFTYKNKKIHIPTYEKYFRCVEEDIRSKNAHYYDELKEHLNLSDRDIVNYHITEKTKGKIQNIIRGLLSDNFIILSPETLSNEPMEKDFWDNLAHELKNMGYEIFCNAMEYRNLIKDTQCCFLTYEESIELSKYAKAIIGMRSGFLECLSQKNIPLFALYTDFPKRSGFKRINSDKVLSGYSISKLPNVNKDFLYEYDVKKYKKDEDIIPDIISKIKQITE